MMIFIKVLVSLQATLMQHYHEHLALMIFSFKATPTLLNNYQGRCLVYLGQSCPMII